MKPIIALGVLTSDLCRKQALVLLPGIGEVRAQFEDGRKANGPTVEAALANLEEVLQQQIEPRKEHNELR